MEYRVTVYSHNTGNVWTENFCDTKRMLRWCKRVGQRVEIIGVTRVGA